MTFSLTRTAALCACIALPGTALAQNMAPELFVDGTCEEKAAWATRPVEDLTADLDTMFGADEPPALSEQMAQQILGMIKDMPVSDAWFAGTCSFSDDQLTAMAPLQEAYYLHMKDLFGQ